MGVPQMIPTDQYRMTRPVHLSSGHRSIRAHSPKIDGLTRSVEAAGDAADEDAEDEIDDDDESRGGPGGVECHPGDVPLVDEGGDRGHDVEGFAGHAAQDPTLGPDSDQHKERGLWELAPIVRDDEVKEPVFATEPTRHRQH